ncbi:MAG: carboxypeptidase regulatory-like domain-containing protein [Bryobacterales bacterium]|nr:carboxypeptidase regulatory-like domain-containing protein [Bryobacterales bacterium]
MKIRGFVRSLAALALLLVAAAMLSSQTTGSIEGTVSDASQAAVPGAKVRIVNQATQIAGDFSTNETGYYLAQNLPVGTYDVEITSGGFRAFTVKGVKLDATARVRVDGTLQLGQVQETVTVEASRARVETTSGTVSTTITRAQVDTAVLNGRNYSRLAMLVPGAVYHSGTDELSGAGLSAPGSVVSINGVNNKSSGWFVDGAYNMNVGNGEANPHIPVLDSIEEVQVQTANYSARYGSTGGAVINAVTRSGTRDLHFSAYEYFRNDKLDARNFFSPTRPPLRQNQFGFTVGGPVVLPGYSRERSKTFFFWSEDWRLRRNAQVNLTATPTEAMRGGDFSADGTRAGAAIRDPLTKIPFANNRIPSSLINSNASLLLQTYFPLPNYGNEAFRNYINNGVRRLDPRTDTVKIDHNFSERWRASFRIANDHVEIVEPSVPLFNATPFPTLRQVESSGGLTGTARVNTVVSPRMTNEFSYSFKRYDVNLLLEGSDVASPVRPSGLTIRDFFSGANDLNLIPNIAFSQGWGGIGTSQLPLKPATDNNSTWADNFSYVRGSHTFQAGISLWQYRKNQAVFNQTMGSYSFDGSFSGHPVADFLQGFARTYGQSRDRYIRDYRFTQTEAYIQDDWRVSRGFTLNLGLRFYRMPLQTVDGDRMSSFDPGRFDPSKAPSIASNGVLVPGANYDPLNGIVIAGQGVPRGFAEPFHAFGPRFGFAWDPTGTGKLAFRGGYGISYLASGTNQSSMVLNPPFNVRVDLNNVSLDDPSGGIPVAPRPVALNSFNPDFKRPMVHSWSATVQTELPGEFLASVGYVGTRGTNWEVWIDRNAPDFAGRPAGLDFDTRINTNTVNLNSIRPFIGYGGITEFNSGLNSTYHSLQTSVQRRFNSGLALQAVYTYGKTVGESQTRRDMRVQNPLNWAADRGPVDFDRTHVFSANYIYAIPFLKGRRDLLGQLAGNWELSGFVTAQSGLALTPGLSTSTRGLATRPDATGVSVKGPKTLSQWFNTKAFVAPALGHYGNSGTGVIRGPSMVIWDASVTKAFPVSEQSRFRLSAEFYNFLNAVNYFGVSTSLGAGNYGSITSTRDARRVQLGLRFDF